MRIKTNNYSLNNLGEINVLLGKNGSGKSRLLRDLDQTYSNGDNDINTKYITPERGGTLTYEPNIERQASNNERWLPNQLRNNQYRQFREQSVHQFRKLELLSLREIESDPELRKDLSYSFDNVIDLINELLENIQLSREGGDFEIYLKDTEQQLQPGQISSGESEIISLAIECMVFEKEVTNELTNILLIDEPDVHLHPDLQSKFSKFLVRIARENPINIVIATHSTALLGSLTESNGLHVGFIQSNQSEITFEPINHLYQKVLPIFGAHPLSNVFNESPIFLVEGEDDLRIWQQAIRTSRGSINIHPCTVDSIDQMHEFEKLSSIILETVYDDAVGFSLRDRDDIDDEEIEDFGCIKRFRLNCRTAENMLLSDEVLNRLNTSWDELKIKIDRWIELNEEHPHYKSLKTFCDNGYQRKYADLKVIRNDLMGIIGSNKPWEIAIGQTIGEKKFIDSEHSISNYLGKGLINQFFE